MVSVDFATCEKCGGNYYPYPGDDAHRCATGLLIGSSSVFAGLLRTCPQCLRYTTAFTHAASRVCQLCETGIEHAYGPDAPPAVVTPREQVLNLAKKAVLTDRQSTHGEPEDTFAAIAALWNAWDQHKSANRGDEHDVAVRMLLLKVARMGQGELNIDDYGDASGYASCAYEAAVKRKGRA